MSTFENNKICFEFSGKKFWFKNHELFEILKSIKNFIKKHHQEEISYLIDNWSKITSFKNSFFSFYNDNYYYKIKELLFFYYIRTEMLKNGDWIAIDMPNLTKEEIDQLKDRAKNYGDYRYSVDNGWLGVLAQDLFCKFLKSRNITFSEYKEECPGIIDEYDVIIKKFKIDIKCATQENYMEITPKVIVEQDKKKDYYIAIKYFSNINKFIIIGYFAHEELGNYPFKALYGTAFWGVKLYSAKPISKFFEIINYE